jgi:hypothetical protein
MDLPPPVQDPERREGADESARRLAAVESELIALGARLEQLEASLQQAVREETRRASNEIRHTVSELGRRLALDLPQFLDRHRQLIVAELRGGNQVGAGAGGGASSAEDPGTAGGSAGDGSQPGAGAATGAAPGAVNPAHADPDSDPDDDTSSDGAGGRRKRRRRKEG